MNRRRTLQESFYYAFRGLWYTLLTQRNMRIHLVAAIAVILISSYLDIATLKQLIVLFAIFLVIVAELFNTAIETTVDLYTQKYRHLAAIAKDVAASAVMLATVNAVIVGYVILFQDLNHLLITIYDNLFDHTLLLLGFVFIATPVTEMIKFIVYGRPSLPAENLKNAATSIILGLVISFMFYLTKHALVAVGAYLFSYFLIQYFLARKITLNWFVTGFLLAMVLLAVPLSS